MLGWIARYTHWLHTQWPAGKPERLPVVREDYTTNIPGLYVVGDLAGVPLLKVSANSGVHAVRSIAAERAFQQRSTHNDVLDIAIVGGGTAGFAAALECRQQELRCCVFEAAEPFSTIANFPKGKPIYTYPTDMPVEGELQFHERSGVKEGLLDVLREQTVERGVSWTQGRVEYVRRRGGLLELVLPEGTDTDATAAFVRAHRVIVAIGRSGNHRKLNVPGENRDKVYNRLHDPADHAGQRVLMVGGGDSALEAAVALAHAGAEVTLSYRQAAFGRARPEHVEAVQQLAAQTVAAHASPAASATDAATTLVAPPVTRATFGSVRLCMASEVIAIDEHDVELRHQTGTVEAIPNDTVFSMIGRDAPLEFFRKSGVRIRGEWTPSSVVALVLFLLFCVWLFHWKAQAPLLGVEAWTLPAWLTPDPADLWAWLRSLHGGLRAYFDAPGTLGHTLAISASGRGFYYTLTYSLVVIIFGLKRMKRRCTPYVKWQTWTLIAIQVVPLFLLPEIILPWLGHNGWFDSGAGRWLADKFFPAVDYGHGREYWRAYGLILAWPLMVWNWFTHEPLWGWLILGFAQTFVAIPAMIYYWGKGAYCGWICSCGALAETLGDTQRAKMPHGPGWNRLNMIGQVLLGFAIVLMALRIVGWTLPPNNSIANAHAWLVHKAPLISWAWFVDLLWAGVFGVGLYFWFSGRVWCRFACPLAALMHIYARFSRFRILADKNKCISCNVCTSVCHQGIDIMSFANKGEPMADPQCVRCSACVQMCPTGVLSFGQVDPRSGSLLHEDPAWLAASEVRMTELTVKGKALSSVSDP